MRRSIIGSILLVLPLAGLPAGSTREFPRSQEKLPAASEILDRFIAATGGSSAYKKLQNQEITGTVEFVDAGIKGKTTEYRAAPAKVYRIVDLPGVGKIEAGTDGRVAWEISSETGPRIKSGEEAATVLREANFNAPLQWRNLYSQAECVGKEIVENQPSFKVVLTPKDGKPLIHYYGEISGLLVKVIMTSITPTMGEVATETSLSEYRNEGGVLVAHRLRRKLLSQQIDTRIESVQFNVEMSEYRFELPAAIKSLLAKKHPADSADPNGTGLVLNQY